MLKQGKGRAVAVCSVLGVVLSVLTAVGPVARAATAAPATPAGFSLSRVAGLGYRVTWLPDDAADAVTGYKLHFHNAISDFTWPLASDAVSFDITPDTAGVCVDGCFVSVAATNDAGDSAPSTDLWFGGNAPDVPQAFTAAEHDATVFFEWDAPVDDGGFPITSYQIEGSLEGNYFDIETSVPAHADPADTHYAEQIPAGNCVDTGCVFRVFAVSAAGRSASTPLQFVAGVPPTAPELSGTVTPGDNGAFFVNLSWTAPSDMGSEAFDSYFGAGGGEGHMDYGADMSQTFECFSYCAFVVAAKAGYLVSPYSNIFAAGPVVAADDTVGHPSDIGLLDISSGSQVVVGTPASFEQLMQLEPVSGQFEPGNYCVRPDLGCTAGWATISGLGGWRINANTGTQTKPSTPAAPTAVSESLTNDDFTVSWTPPSNGGNAITSYDVQVELPASTLPTDWVPDGVPTWRTVVTTGGTSVQHVRCPPSVADGTCHVRVIARNAFGFSDPSAPAPMERDAVTAVPDWTMPPQVKDTNDDGVPDSYLRNGEQTAKVPSDGRYPVNLDGCASTGTITTYSWVVDGAAPHATSGCVWHTRLTEGAHDVVLTTLGAAGGQATTAITVTVKNFLVLGLGDSYGAGEGNPHKSAGGVTWDNRPCHRSVYSGQALSALRLEKSDPRTSVTFVHLACSGATVFKGILGAYLDPPGSATNYQTRQQKPQIVRASQIADGQKYDAVILSIGGNDIGFSNIVKTCLAYSDCATTRNRLPALVGDNLWQKLLNIPAGLVVDNTLHRETELKMRNLAGRYMTVSRCLSTKSVGCHLVGGKAFPSLGVNRAHIFLTEYPDATRGDDGTPCGRFLTAREIAGDKKWFLLPHRLKRLLEDTGITANESRWVEHPVVTGRAGTTYTFHKSGGGTVELAVISHGLNRVISTSAASLGWTHVGGISTAFVKHGYCANNHWVRRYQESKHLQGDDNGAVHPNHPGQRAYAAQISPLLISRMGAPIPGPTGQ